MRDLIDECGEDLASIGYKCKEKNCFGLCVCSMEIKTEEEEKRTGFEEGEYHIVNCKELPFASEDCLIFVAKEIQKIICGLLKKFSISKTAKILVVGLGNPQILADGLGTKVVDFVRLKSFGKDNNIFKFCPNIFTNTGINAVEVVGMLVSCLSVDCVFVIDSLATKSIERLACSVQINSAGITPGSAVNNSGKKIGSSTLGVPCIAIGVPLMFFGEDFKKKEILLTTKDIHQNLDDISFMIATAINSALKV